MLQALLPISVRAQEFGCAEHIDGPREPAACLDAQTVLTGLIHVIQGREDESVGSNRACECRRILHRPTPEAGRPILDLRDSERGQLPRRLAVRARRGRRLPARADP